MDISSNTTSDITVVKDLKKNNSSPHKALHNPTQLLSVVTGREATTASKQEWQLRKQLQ